MFLNKNKFDLILFYYSSNILLNKYLFSLLLQNMSVSIFPVDYERFTDKMMSLPLPLYVEPELELYGHPIGKNLKTEFNEKRGDYISAYGWRLFWDKVGTHQPHYLYNRGYLYDAENGLGYVGKMITVSGKPYPSIECWAMRTRLNHPDRSKYEIDKNDAIYYYESLDMC